MAVASVVSSNLTRVLSSSPGSRSLGLLQMVLLHQVATLIKDAGCSGALLHLVLPQKTLPRVSVAAPRTCGLRKNDKCVRPAGTRCRQDLFAACGVHTLVFWGASHSHNEREHPCAIFFLVTVKSISKRVKSYNGLRGNHLSLRLYVKRAAGGGGRGATGFNTGASRRRRRCL